MIGEEDMHLEVWHTASIEGDKSRLGDVCRVKLDPNFLASLPDNTLNQRFSGFALAPRTVESVCPDLTLFLVSKQNLAILNDNCECGNFHDFVPSFLSALPSSIIDQMDLLVIFGADWLPIVFLILFLYWWLEQINLDRRKLLVATLGSALIARFFFGTILKNLFVKARPDEALALISADGYAFPSGHATFFFALATSVYLHDKRWGVIFYILAALLSLSRVMAHVHDYVDILGGVILGVLVALISSRLFKTNAKSN